MTDKKRKRFCKAKELEDYRKQLKKEYESSVRINICDGTGCRAYGSESVADALEAAIAKQGLEATAKVKRTGCPGFCDQGAVAVIQPQGLFYRHIKPTDADEIVTKTVAKNEVVESLLYKDPKTKEKIIHEKDVPFYSKQTRVLLANNGNMEPKSIEDYICINNGYAALGKVVEGMTPDEVIDEVKKSGLRGLGGGGFPTGRKWEACRQAEGDIKYIICNGDEGDPGAFMDRSILEGNPHSVIEGMIIAGYAVGSVEGYIYVRAEYPLAVENLNIAISQAEQMGLLGENILDSGFNFKLYIKEGAGAFVCGESTALVLSIEGKRGMPKAHPRPRTTDIGLWDKPTVLNNVKTFANIPVIVNNGSQWFASRGTETSKGTAIFSITGNVKNTGLVEVPMGITLRELIVDIAGGVDGKRPFKALQTGGPSGGCLPENMLDMKVDFDSLKEAGAMMGSGGMVVMDKGTCMVEVARYFLAFSVSESCGKCVPCRVGNKILHGILTRIVEGKGEEGDIELLESLSQDIEDLAICGLGQTSPNPVLTTIRYFRDEYEAHIKEKHCPAAVCVALTKFEVDPQICTKCGRCAKVCPTGAVQWEKKEIAHIDIEKCIKCRACIKECPFMAIK